MEAQQGFSFKAQTITLVAFEDDSSNIVDLNNFQNPRNHGKVTLQNDNKSPSKINFTWGLSLFYFLSEPNLKITGFPWL